MDEVKPIILSQRVADKVRENVRISTLESLTPQVLMNRVDYISLVTLSIRRADVLIRGVRYAKSFQEYRLQYQGLDYYVRGISDIIDYVKLLDFPHTYGIGRKLADGKMYGSLIGFQEALLAILVDKLGTDSVYTVEVMKQAIIYAYNGITEGAEDKRANLLRFITNCENNMKVTPTSTKFLPMSSPSEIVYSITFHGPDFENPDLVTAKPIAYNYTVWKRGVTKITGVVLSYSNSPLGTGAELWNDFESSGYITTITPLDDGRTEAFARTCSLRALYHIMVKAEQFSRNVRSEVLFHIDMVDGVGILDRLIASETSEDITQLATRYNQHPGSIDHLLSVITSILAFRSIDLKDIPYPVIYDPFGEASNIRRFIKWQRNPIVRLSADVDIPSLGNSDYVNVHDIVNVLTRKYAKSLNLFG